jgi:hypothetical protein
VKLKRRAALAALLELAAAADLAPDELRIARAFSMVGFHTSGGFLISMAEIPGYIWTYNILV